MSVALIGSSGGGTATLGHTDAAELLRVIHQELQKVDGSMGIVQALFVSLHGGKGFDSAKLETDVATLFSISSNDCQIQSVQTGIVEQVNKTCKQMDEDLAKQIRCGQIDGLICISCNVDVHAATLQAAAEARIPVTGSGGTSLSEATSKFGIHLVGNAGGSVATTSYTRAVSYTHALATAWNKMYHPFSSSQNMVPNWTSILNACLPAFWAVTLACRGVDIVAPLLADSSWLTDQVLPFLQSQALPTTCCVVMATALAPHHGSTALMAASVASVVCQKSVLGGLVAGWLVALAVGRVLYQCIVWNIPATMTNLVVAGGIGAAIAVIMAPLIPSLQLVTEYIRWAIHVPMDGSYPGVGFLIGVLFCWGSKVGLYHAICLPIILIEMELGSPSLWGAIDEATLVLVSAGICSANLLVPSTHDGVETTALCKRGVCINVLFGDFIEVAYPFMEKSLAVNIGGYLASGVATELLTGDTRSVLSSAYLPLPISVLLANDQMKIAVAYGSAFGICFVVALVNNLVASSHFVRPIKQD